jgi:tRNA-2-methylthio-N6-dimethylallyladenosine synthase
MAITTDIIVGFPGETEQDFQETLEVMDIVQFENSYSYAFSARPSTEAAAMEETMTQDEKLERLQILQARQEQMTDAKLSSWVGRETEVLVDNVNRLHNDCYQGRIPQNFMANFLQPFEGVSLGSLVKVRIVGRKRFTLIAEPVAP